MKTSAIILFVFINLFIYCYGSVNIDYTTPGNYILKPENYGYSKYIYITIQGSFSGSTSGNIKSMNVKGQSTSGNINGWIYTNGNMIFNITIGKGGKGGCYNNIENINGGDTFFKSINNQIDITVSGAKNDLSKTTFMCVKQCKNLCFDNNYYRKNGGKVIIKNINIQSNIIYKNDGYSAGFCTNLLCKENGKLRQFHINDKNCNYNLRNGCSNSYIHVPECSCTNIDLLSQPSYSRSSYGITYGYFENCPINYTMSYQKFYNTPIVIDPWFENNICGNDGKNASIKITYWPSNLTQNIPSETLKSRLLETSNESLKSPKIPYIIQTINTTLNTTPDENNSDKIFGSILLFLFFCLITIIILGSCLYICIVNVDEKCK